MVLLRESVEVSFALLCLSLTHRVSLVLGVAYPGMPGACHMLPRASIPSWFAMAAILFTSLLKPSICPCVFGCLGVAVLCLNPISTANSLHSLELNGGPLSVFCV